MRIDFFSGALFAALFARQEANAIALPTDVTTAALEASIADDVLAQAEADANALHCSAAPIVYHHHGLPPPNIKPPRMPSAPDNSKGSGGRQSGGDGGGRGGGNDYS